ncbi:MAG: arginine--tRNA ligase [Candidatus Hatepunaea meridiana]|nr:arginine--tRNA ligase [Candidatus Hatepunaea meridiana]
MMLENSIESVITSSLVEICRKYGIPAPQVVLEIPRDKKHGELSCNIALTSTRQTGMKPRDLAEKLSTEFPTSKDLVDAVIVAGPGFLNFKLSALYFHNLLKDIVKDSSCFGTSDEGSGERWLFEFVSANPTGPLNVVNARAASIGDTLVRIFKKRGYDAHSEFYVNDGGNQIRLLGASVRARIENVEIPEGGYHGEYVYEYAKSLIKNKEYNTELNSSELYIYNLGRRFAQEIQKEHKVTLDRFRVSFDNWFFESKLHILRSDQNSPVASVVNSLQDKDATYESDGALYFKAGEYGDSKDRVLRKSHSVPGILDEDFDPRQIYTYIVPDTAYHLDKYQRGFIKAVDLLGPDHHGYIISMKASLKALEIPDNFYHAILVQQVNLKRDGEEVKMSKRAGVGITLDDLIEEVGVDTARFFFLRRTISSHLDFDIELAKRHSEDNPVYYVQYAHARIMSILRQPGAKDFDKNVHLECLTTEEELDLLKVIARFPWTLSSIVRNLEPHILTVYLIELARSFHFFYSKHRVITDNSELTAARLMLCKGTANVIAEGLSLMGIEAPEVM